MGKIATMVYTFGAESGSMWRSRELRGDNVGYDIRRGVGHPGSPHDTARIWNEGTTLVVPLNRLISIEVTEEED